MVQTPEKKYYLRQHGRITGPHTMLRLTARYNSGTLYCEDMISEDKRHWLYINVLFPALTPDTLSGGSREEAAGTPEVGSVSPDFPPVLQEDSPAAPVVPEAVHPAEEWLMDVGRTIALLWNFQEIQQKYEAKGGRFLGIAAGGYCVLAVIFVLFFGRFYSFRFDKILSPLMGLSLIAALLGIACLMGLWLGKYCAPDAPKIPQTWKIMAAGLLMDYGTLACCVMALWHGVGEYLPVLLLLTFINSLIMCSSALQVRDHLERAGRLWRLPVLGAVLLLNPFCVAIVYCFTIFV